MVSWGELFFIGVVAVLTSRRCRSAFGPRRRRCSERLRTGTRSADESGAAGRGAWWRTRRWNNLPKQNLCSIATLMSARLDRNREFKLDGPARRTNMKKLMRRQYDASRAVPHRAKLGPAQYEMTDFEANQERATTVESRASSQRRLTCH